MENASQIWNSVDHKNTKLVVIDEAQFFDHKLVDVIDCLALEDIRVLVGGLRADFRNMPFGPMDNVLPRADDIVTLTAICKFRIGREVCREDATRTQRLINGEPARFDDPIILVGAENFYEARCAKHHEVPGLKEYLLEINALNNA